MNRIKTVFISCSFLLFCIGGANAQSGTVATGGIASGPEGTVSYTIGTVNYAAIENGSITITQGIQQPYEIQIINGITETAVTLGSVYPNPTADYVVLSLTGDLQNMHYILSDVHGKMISQQTLTKQQTNIPMAELANGAYLVKVYNSKKEIKTYKIIKNN